MTQHDKTAANPDAQVTQVLGSTDAPAPNPSQSIVTTTPSSTSSPSSATGTASSTNSQSQTSPSTTAQPSFDLRLPPGGISMISPNVYTTSYYKIGDYVTFAWNYTSLSVTPTAIDILATCSANQATYTLALNQSVISNSNSNSSNNNVGGQTGAVTWDTGAYQKTGSPALLVATYTLIIYDAAKDPTSAPSSGYLTTYNTFKFAMYDKGDYNGGQGQVPVSCVTCSGAAGLERAMAVVMVVAIGVGIILV